jgi:tRNA(fMet)-specific endonuclease VapC
MFVLDTDHLSLLEKANSTEGNRLHNRLAQIAPEEWGTTIVNYEEQMRGWLEYIKHAEKSKDLSKQVEAYRRLSRHLNIYCQLAVLEFDAAAAANLQGLRQARLKIKGKLDLKIAAIVLAQDAVLLTRNQQDFRKVPGLKIEDWTLEVTG